MKARDILRSVDASLRQGNLQDASRNRNNSSIRAAKIEMKYERIKSSKAREQRTVSSISCISPELVRLSSENGGKL